MTEQTPKTHIVTVHGTFSGRAIEADPTIADEQYYAEQSEFARSLSSKIPNVQWHEYQWSGKNLESERYRAGKKFKKFVSKITDNPDDRLMILAHSHGGNVALDGLRKSHIPNPIRLYTFGTPFTWRRNPSIISTIGLFLPNLVFFLAVLFIAAVLAQGHLQYIVYGIPFFEMPTGEKAATFFKAFNDKYAFWTAGLMLVLATIFLVILPLSRLLYFTGFHHKDPQKFHLFRIWRTDDEAIAVLRTSTKISIPVTIFNSFFRVTSALILVVFVGLSLRHGYKSLVRFRETHDPESPIEQILLFGAEFIGTGVFIVVLLLFLNLIIQFVFKVPLSWLMSRPINSILRKTSIGEDSYQRITVHARPDIAEDFVTELNEYNSDIAEVLDDVKELSDLFVLENRTNIMRALTNGEGYLLEVLSERDLANSLIHCNYFTLDMANYLATHYKEQAYT